MSPVGESKLPSYDGLLANSTELWRKFLKLYEDRFEKFWYNVRVGAGTRPPLTTSRDMQRMWWATTCLRIDVVGERPGESWVFEVAPHPTSRVVGNLQLYAHLLPLYQGRSATKMDVIVGRNAQDFLLDTIIHDKIITALVCVSIGSDFRASIERVGIMVFTFPDVGQPKLPPQFLPSFAAAGA